MQFASGTPPTNVKEHDLESDLTEEAAHSLIAKTVSQYLLRIVSGSNKDLESLVASSEEFFAPIIKSLELEGFYNFKPPCWDHDEVNTIRPTCTHGSPWVEEG